jgi:hypothetical protein
VSAPNGIPDAARGAGHDGALGGSDPRPSARPAGRWPGRLEEAQMVHIAHTRIDRASDEAANALPAARRGGRDERSEAPRVG